VAEFLGLKDEYSETDLEEALIHRLESFLLELEGTSALSAGRSGCVSATSGIGWIWSSFTRPALPGDCRLEDRRFMHADVGQMHLYLNYAQHIGFERVENPPVGADPCASAKD